MFSRPSMKAHNSLDAYIQVKNIYSTSKYSVRPKLRVQGPAPGPEMQCVSQLRLRLRRSVLTLTARAGQPATSPTKHATNVTKVKLCFAVNYVYVAAISTHD